MIQWIGAAVAALLTLGALCSPTIAWAKPADLPAEVQQQCPDGRDGQHAEGFGPRPTEPPPSPSGRGVTPAALRIRAEAVPALTPVDLQARELFELGEHSRAAGDPIKARVCYEEAHLLSPTSPHGRLAIDRLWELDRARLKNAEQADAQSPRQLRGEPTQPRRETSRSMDDDGPLGYLDLVVRWVLWEQAAPPRPLRCEPTGRPCGRNVEPTLRQRETTPTADDDARLQQMLRSTEPLGTQPDVEAEADEQDGWLQSTIDNIRNYIAWKKANAMRSAVVLCGQPRIDLPGREMAQWVALAKYSPFINELTERLQINEPRDRPTAKRYTPIVWTLEGVVDGEPSARKSESTTPRLAAVQCRFRLLQTISAWQAPEQCLLIDRDLREQWRHDVSYLIPDESSALLPMRWLNEDGTVQVITGSSNMISALASDAVMVIVMPTRVEFIPRREANFHIGISSVFE
ncbi:MAG: hypothetical protein L0Y71_25245 [Gemmataceae bacterium]|nr:hypothetical protein [Gemmataceae bacterium]